MRSGIVHHKSDRKPCVIPTADRNKLHFPEINETLREWAKLLVTVNQKVTGRMNLPLD